MKPNRLLGVGPHLPSHPHPSIGSVCFGVVIGFPSSRHHPQRPRSEATKAKEREEEEEKSGRDDEEGHLYVGGNTFCLLDKSLRDVGCVCMRRV